MNECPTLDPAAVERLRKLGGDKFAGEMIDLFLDYVPKKLTEARKAQTAGDLPGVQKAVHPIKSSAGNVGAAHLQALATRLESEARGGEGDIAAASLAELENAFAAVRPELELRKSALTVTPAHP